METHLYTHVFVSKIWVFDKLLKKKKLKINLQSLAKKNCFLGFIIFNFFFHKINFCWKISIPKSTFFKKMSSQRKIFGVPPFFSKIWQFFEFSFENLMVFNGLFTVFSGAPPQLKIARCRQKIWEPLFCTPQKNLAKPIWIALIIFPLLLLCG